MRIRRSISSQSKGFTLIELISVIVILSLIATAGSRFLITAVSAYQQTQARTKMVGKGRAAIEQMSRQLRGAVPNSLRVSPSGRCVEFLPIVAGALYIDDVADEFNLAAGTSSIATSAFTLGLGAPAYVVIGAYNSSEIYTTALPSARANLSGSLVNGPFTTVSLSGNHIFNRNSPRKRLFVAATPRRFCVLLDELRVYSNYGLLTSAMTDTNPGGDSDLMATNVISGDVVFSLSVGSLDRNAAIDIALQFSENNARLTLNQQVLLRNVP